MAAMVGMRELGPPDEAALQALLRAVYGETYSHRGLYETGGVSALIASGRAALWGDFAEGGALASHTGFFFKDPRGDYVESGLSLRSPTVSPITSDAVVWEHLVAWLRARSEQLVYMHQNTTSLHPLAQRYAARHMRARPSGVVFDYAVGERIGSLARTGGPMQALTMTSLLRDAHPRPEVPVPEGPWADFIAFVASGLGLDPARGGATPPPSDRAPALDPEPIETNVALGLLRRCVARAADGEPARPAGVRTDLVHLPLDERAVGLGGFIDAGWLPVGLRPHASRPHELVLQHLPGDRRAQASESLAHARLAPPGRALGDAWRRACARAS